MNAVAPRPVGKWQEGMDETDHPYGICSLCGHADYDVLGSGEQYRYCPSCGAKME